MDKKFIEIDGINTAYIQRLGGNEVVVILHGWGANVESIVPIVNAIPEKYTVYAYDAPGFGDSEDPNFVMGTKDYKDFLESFLQAFNIEKAHFIGHSFGGKTLTLFAAASPEKIGKLVLVDASGVRPKRPLKYFIKVYTFKILKKIYLLFHQREGREASLEKFYKKFGSEDYKNADGILRKCFVKVVNEDTDHVFSQIPCETLLIWGDQDDATPLYMAKVFEERIPDAGLVILKDAGHYSYLDDYGTFHAVLQSFLG